MKPPILSPRRLDALGLVVLSLGQFAAAHAWSLTIAAASRRVFLHVGNGTYDGNNGTVNLVSANLSAAQLLSGTAQPMTSNSTQSRSLYGDNYTTCPFNGGTQTLATVPANRYIENCHSFIYANSALRAAGTYNGQVTYPLSSP